MPEPASAVPERFRSTSAPQSGRVNHISVSSAGHNVLTAGGNVVRPQQSAYSATRHPKVSPNTHDGYINVGGCFELSPSSARAFAAALVSAADAQEQSSVHSRCDCPNDGEHCPHCGRYPLTVRHSDRCHKAALDD